MSLNANNVSLKLGRTQLLDAVNVTVEPGKVTALLGPNGAGKTSLLRLLSCDLKPDEGSVALNGRAIDEQPTMERARQLAVLPQHSVLEFPFTAEEVAMLGRIPHDTGSLRDREIVRDALHVVDAAYLAEREYTRLSGGERQRVQMARVLAQVWEPQPDADRFLLLDEPTSSLDLAHQQVTLEIVDKLTEQGVGVLIVLHDLNLASRCAHQLVLLCCGQVASSGTPSQVLTPATIERVFQVEASVMQHPDRDTPMVVT